MYVNDVIINSSIFLLSDAMLFIDILNRLNFDPCLFIISRALSNTNVSNANSKIAQVSITIHAIDRKADITAPVILRISDRWGPTTGTFSIIFKIKSEPLSNKVIAPSVLASEIYNCRFTSPSLEKTNAEELYIEVLSNIFRRTEPPVICPVG
jgi:hypothetical protein